jgi:ABC-type sugar transport system ATPase subunit
MTSSENHIALEVSEVTKSFGAVRALKSVSCSVKVGEVLGVIGDNGAGKSTLVNIVSGTLRPDHGRILVDGVERAFADPADAREHGIETIFQFLSLVLTLDIAENIFLNREIYGPGPLLHKLRRMDKREMGRRVSAGYERLGLSLPSPRTKVAALSGGQRQAVAIARVVLWGSHIVLMDEPAAALGVKQTEIVLSFIERLKAQGVAVILISHNMEHVIRVCDRFVVLRLGEKVADVPKHGTTALDLVAMLTGATTVDGLTPSIERGIGERSHPAPRP